MNFRHNEQIRISPVRLVNDKEEQVGIVPTNEALRMAREAGLDLVEVAPTARPPVCRIMDYGKWRYQQQKKEDKSRASSRGGRLKQQNIDTVRIGEHDLEIKINRAREFLKDGNKVQFTLRFKGREMAHQNLGYELFKKIKEALWPVSKVERDAKMEGRRMSLVLQPETKAPGAKMPVPGAKNSGGTAPAPVSIAGRPPAGPVGSGLNLPTRAVPPGPGGPVGALHRPGPVGPGISRPVGTPPPGAAAPAPRPPAPVPAPAQTPEPSGVK